MPTRCARSLARTPRMQARIRIRPRAQTHAHAQAQARTKTHTHAHTCDAPNHSRTHADKHTHAHERARHECPNPSRQPPARGQGAPPHWVSIQPTSAPGLGSPPPTTALGLAASATVHLHRDWAAALDPSLLSCPATSARGLRAPTAHICTGSSRSSCYGVGSDGEDDEVSRGAGGFCPR